MNWLRHELLLRAHKVGRAEAIHGEARNHDASLRASIHDGNAVKSFSEEK
jgi:hypothetical protein